jgi:hypothetical protein
MINNNPNIPYAVFIIYACSIWGLICALLASVGIVLSLSYSPHANSYLYYLSWALLLLAWLSHERDRL